MKPIREEKAFLLPTLSDVKRPFYRQRQTRQARGQLTDWQNVQLHLYLELELWFSIFKMTSTCFVNIFTPHTKAFKCQGSVKRTVCDKTFTAVSSSEKLCHTIQKTPNPTIFLLLNICLSMYTHKILHPIMWITEAPGGTSWFPLHLPDSYLYSSNFGNFRIMHLS